MQQTEMQALLRQLMNQTDHPEAVQAAQRLQEVLQAPQGKELAQQLMNRCGSHLEQAAKRAQSGDMAGAKQALQRTMQTPEGAQLVSQLARMMGR